MIRRSFQQALKMIEWIYVFLGVFPIAVYLYLTRINNYWKKKGISQLDPWPIIGNILDVVLQKKNITYCYNDAYEKFPEAPAIGFYQMMQPVLIVKDPELIKTVLVKDFSSFHDNSFFADEKIDPYSYRDSFLSRGTDWKFHRSAIVPTFNVSRMKSIFPQMKEVAKQLEDHLDSNLDTDIEAKDLALLFTTDVVSNCAFGISGNSFIGTEAVFKQMGKLMTDELEKPYHSFALLVMPILAKLLKVKLIPDSVGKFLEEVIIQTEEYRRKNNIERNDFLQYILNLRGKKPNPDSSREYTITDIIGYAMTFFVEGFETSSIVASFALYELARNSDIQETLRTEILNSVTQSKDLDYEKLHSMSYLNNVLSETLRKYPVTFSMTRSCTQDTTLNVGGNNVVVEKGIPVIIPVYSIQNDPKYFPNPKKFDPERFSEDNISSRPPYTYIPFGEGPRICVGMRFGLTQIKLFLVTILLKYKILPTKKTPKEICFSKLSILTSSKESLFIKFQKRET